MSIARRLVFAALLAGPATVSAQGTTADLIQQGIAAFEGFQTEAARILFQRVILPSNPSPVSPDQRVTAYKYLGASYALDGKPDSAQIFFSAALEYDPFTDLDLSKFSEAEIAPFNVAKNSVFRIGVRPFYSAVVNPRADTTAYRFTIVSTHRGRMRVELIRQTGDTIKETLLDAENDGLRVITWDGLLRIAGGGRIADSSTYMLRVIGTSSLARVGAQAGTAAPTDTIRELLRVEHSYDPLEDTLPTLPDSMLLPARITAAAPWVDLAKGIGFGLLAGAIPFATLSADLDWELHAGAAVGASIVSGFGSFFYRTRRREIPENVAENARRQQQRTAFNDGVNARNAQRIAQTLLIITPITAGR